MPATSITLTINYAPPADGWPDVPTMHHGVVTPELVTLTATAGAGGTVDVLDVCSVHGASALSTGPVIAAAYVRALPPFGSDLVAAAESAARTAFAATTTFGGAA